MIIFKIIFKKAGSIKHLWPNPEPSGGGGENFPGTIVPAGLNKKGREARPPQTV